MTGGHLQVHSQLLPQPLTCPSLTCRRHRQQQRLASARAAAVALQCAWRAQQAAALLQQHKAAVVIQKTFRAYSVRQQVALQAASATAIQTYWRGHYQLQRYQQVSLQADMHSMSCCFWPSLTGVSVMHCMIACSAS